MEIESPVGQLSKLIQMTMVEDYQSCFEDLALCTHNLYDEFLLDCFISRLRTDIKLEVLGHRSTSMTEVQALARFHEARLHARRYLGSTSGFKLPPLLPTPGLPSTGPKVQRSRPPPLEQQHPPANTATPVHRISSVEAQAHRQKGLCYYCVD
ncbi:hypothetical protein GOBAR_AA02020 [Gossypium barbadense]|uniref:Uncharacterized protein n=1 Tax=Gossypium barbadense TaxID=3634 RepID=A0A2P5YSI3_GOSBA|nr:hypothetical protein GOBAR_AA02020 [Gossypium barbadense]